MEFWGVEVKSGQPLKVEPGLGMILHLSQASIGEVKKDKGSEAACLFVNVNGKKLVLGTLFPDKLPQQQFDLVFDEDFELSHNWKSGSVYFYGYKVSNPDQEVDEDSEGEMVEMPIFADNRKSETNAEQQKPAGVGKVNASKEAACGKQKVKIVEPNKEAKPEEDDEDSEEDDTDDDDLDEDVSSDEDMEETDDESDSDEDDESDEETPKKKVEIGKKRATESATKTPVPDKKAKVATPRKTDGKKGSSHVATPYPSKPNKSSQLTPKSSGSHVCSSCKRSFGSENALQSHTKAKHGAGN